MSWQLQDELDELRHQGLWRELRRLDSPQEPLVQFQGKTYLNFSSNDYLGLATSEALKTALQEGIARYGVGSGASRLVCGTLSPHAELEEALAAFKGTEAALTFTSGFAVPIGTLPALLGPGDTVILDKLSHACLVDAAKLTRATIRVFPHNHLEKLERLLQTAKGRVLVVTESIFSMDGDAALLREIVELKDRYGAWLLLDEAHAVGVLGPQGRGLAASLGLEKRIELQMGTLSKALGLSGGYLAASRAVIDLLINRARSFIYTTAPSPGLAVAACESLRIIQGCEGDQRRERLQQHVRRVRALIEGEDETPNTGPSPQPSSRSAGRGSQTWVSPGADKELTLSPLAGRGQGEGSKETENAAPSSAIIPFILGDEKLAMKTSTALREAGLLVPAIRYPTVARGTARLRITLSAAHQPEQVDALLDQLKGLIPAHHGAEPCH